MRQCRIRKVENEAKQLEFHEQHIDYMALKVSRNRSPRARPSAAIAVTLGCAVRVLRCQLAQPVRPVPAFRALACNLTSAVIVQRELGEKRFYRLREQHEATCKSSQLQRVAIDDL